MKYKVVVSADVSDSADMLPSAIIWAVIKYRQSYTIQCRHTTPQQSTPIQERPSIYRLLWVHFSLLQYKTPLIGFMLIVWRMWQFPAHTTLLSTGDLVFGLQGSTTGAQQIAVAEGNYTFIQLSTYIQTRWFTLTCANITLNFNQPNFRLRDHQNRRCWCHHRNMAPQLALAGMGRILGFNSVIAPATLLVAQATFHITGPTRYTRLQ